jgi:hypothetical protein
MKTYSRIFLAITSVVAAVLLSYNALSTSRSTHVEHYNPAITSSENGAKVSRINNLVDLMRRSTAAQNIISPEATHSTKALPVGVYRTPIEAILGDKAPRYGITHNELVLLQNAYDDMQEARARFEHEIATVTHPSPFEADIEIPQYATAGEQLATAFKEDMSNILGSQRADSLFADIRDKLSTESSGFGANPQKLIIVLDESNPQQKIYSVQHEYITSTDQNNTIYAASVAAKSTLPADELGYYSLYMADLPKG